MKRRLFNVAAVISLVLGLATAAMWCRSAVREDHWFVLAGQVPFAELNTVDGHAVFRYRPSARQVPARERTGWRHTSSPAQSVRHRVKL